MLQYPGRKWQRNNIQPWSSRDSAGLTHIQIVKLETGSAAAVPRGKGTGQVGRTASAMSAILFVLNPTEKIPR